MQWNCVLDLSPSQQLRGCNQSGHVGEKKNLLTFQRQFIASQRFKCFSHLQLCSSVTTAAISSLELTFEYVHKHVSYTNKNEIVPPHLTHVWATRVRLLRACLLVLHVRSNRILSSTMLKLVSDWLYTKHIKGIQWSCTSLSQYQTGSDFVSHKEAWAQ